MNTDRLEEFAALARTLNFSKAADSLFISQSILSRHIKELEAEVGHSLLYRDTHEVRLTEEGKYFLNWTQSYLRNQDQVLSAMFEEPFSEAATVKIFTSEQVITTSVLSFIHSFIEQYPNIHLDIVPLLTAESSEQIYSCDIMLSAGIYLQRPNDRILVEHLANQQPLLAIPPRHHFGDYQEITLKDLAGENLIVPFASDIYGPYARNALTANRKCQGQLKRIGAENAQAGLLKVELGAGVMLMPHHLAHRVYSHTQTLSVVDPDCVFPVYAYRNTANVSRAADLFYEKICDLYRNKQ